MDPIQVAILLSWVEIKSVCELLVKHPDNDDELAVAEHILMVMDRYIQEAKPGSRTPIRSCRYREEPGDPAETDSITPASDHPLGFLPD